MAEPKRNWAKCFAILSVLSSVTFLAAFVVMEAIRPRADLPVAMVESIILGTPAAALVFGYVGLSSSRKGEKDKWAELLSTVGVWTGWAAAACIVALFAIESRTHAVDGYTPNCRTNLKQIGFAIGLYQADNDEQVPLKLL